MAREDWKVGDVLVCKWGDNAGEKRTISRQFKVLSLDDTNVLDVVFEGSDATYHQLDLIRKGWGLLRKPFDAND